MEKIKFGDPVEYMGVKSQVISEPFKSGTKRKLNQSGLSLYPTRIPPAFTIVDKMVVILAYFPEPVDIDDIKKL